MNEWRKKREREREELEHVVTIPSDVRIHLSSSFYFYFVSPFLYLSIFRVWSCSNPCQSFQTRWKPIEWHGKRIRRAEIGRDELVDRLQESNITRGNWTEPKRRVWKTFPIPDKLRRRWRRRVIDSSCKFSRENPCESNKTGQMVTKHTFVHSVW